MIVTEINKMIEQRSHPVPEMPKTCIVVRKSDALYAVKLAYEQGKTDKEAEQDYGQQEIDEQMRARKKIHTCPQCKRIFSSIDKCDCYSNNVF